MKPSIQLATPATIVLATGNPYKVEEMTAIFAALLPGIDVRFQGLKEVRPAAPITEPAETGTTFEENASIKAISYASQTGMWCLADDSGLEIDALGGRPGVISSHYSSDGREMGLSRAERDQANNQRILRELDGIPPARRSARFVCVMCLSSPAPQQSTPLMVRGAFEGSIGLPGQVPRGEHGFGYDPLFLVAPAFTRTSSELPPAEKNLLSHRAGAARLMADEIRKLLKR